MARLKSVVSYCSAIAGTIGALRSAYLMVVYGVYRKYISSADLPAPPVTHSYVFNLGTSGNYATQGTLYDNRAFAYNRPSARLGPVGGT